MTLGRVKTERASSLFAGDGEPLSQSTGRDFEYATCTNEFQFVRAPVSGLVFLQDRPVEAALGTIYPDHYEPYLFENFPPLVRKAREFVQKGKVAAVRKLAPQCAEILDVGCGSGALLRLLRACGDASWKLYANELHRPSLDRLEREGFRICENRIEQVPGENLFDLIILNQVIEHFADVRNVMAACSRLLKSGGHILVETPSTSGWDYELFRDRHWGGYHFPRHFYLFDEATLGRLFDEFGMTVTGVRYLASPAFWTQSLHHRISESRWPSLARWFHLTNIPLAAAVTAIDVLRIKLGLKTSNMRVVARKP